MRLKKFIPIFLMLLLFVCCVSAVNAASDNDDALDLSENEEVSLISDVDEISQANPDTLSAPQVNTLEKTNDDVVAMDESKKPVSSAESQFRDDLDEGKSNVVLTEDIKITEPFIIRAPTVIDGQGHTIDALQKTNIFILKDKLTLKNMKLINGKAAQGGAIYSYTHNLIIDKCTFENNFATENGGAIYISTADLTITNSNFKSNKVENSKSSGHGGAVWIYKGSSKISKTTFSYNSAVSKKLKDHKKATKYQFGGGAVYYNEGNKHYLTECTFTGNKASNHGGAVYGHKPKSLTIKKCTFNKNKVSFEDGGAITFNGNKLSISNSKFTNNLAYEDGGVMDVLSLTKSKTYITITDTVFKGNTAYKGAGCIWMGVKTVFTLKNNQFIKNKASIGGAIFSEAGIAKITKCVFKSNKAGKVTSWTVKTKAGGVLKHCGGAIMIQNKNIKISKCTFNKNKATWGGAIFFKAGKLSFSGNKLSSNKAKGGTAFFSPKKVKISNKNKWGSKSTTKKALKVKHLIEKSVSAK
jgi:predicted outer membrane repeat protein